MKLVNEQPDQPPKPETGAGREARIGQRESRVEIPGKTRSGKTRSRIDISGKSGMDVARAPRGKRKRYIYMGIGAVALIFLTIFLAGLEPAAPTVDRDIILIGTVERGSFVREVRGPGTLVPEQIVFVSALTGGRVEQVLVNPGETVGDTSLIVVLSNPDVELEALQAMQQLTAARARLVELQRTLGTLILQEQSAVASAEADWLDAQRNAEAFAELVENQTVSRAEASRAQERADAARVRLDTEQSRLALLEQTNEAQLEVQREQVQSLESIQDYQTRRVESMRVTARASGVIQDFDLEIGQWIQPGTMLARVAQPGRLQAELRIPEVQARDVQTGQPVIVDTRTDSIPGRVRRVDPNVQGGSVLVEVRLEGDLPPGARPDLSVDGTIQIERLQDVLFVDRPAYGQANSTVSLFKVLDGENEAVRITTRLGRSSVSEIEILEGLQAGDRIILTDMSRWDEADRVNIR